MSLISLRVCDFDQNDPMRGILKDMNRRQEEDVIATAKKLIKEGKITRIRMCVDLEKFMDVWDGARKFHLIPAYIASLKWSNKDGSYS